MPIGTNGTGKMVTALRRLGFDKVFDTNTGADFTIMEEANELIERLTKGGVTPMITSCSPGWIKYIEMNYPDQLPHLSSCKSPHQMFGALIKSYYAEKIGVAPEKICVVSVMPCVAKKFEAKREQMEVNSIRDVDYVITTRELARMIKQAGIDFVNLEETGFDDPMGEATGAAAIFGTTGGVMEAALRTAYETITGETLKDVNFEAVRGAEGIKRATVKIGDKEVKAVVAHGLGNAQIVMDEIRDGKADYQFVEIMACPGGCIMGGGQPIRSSKDRATIDIRKLRADCLYTIDEKSTLRKSHENPVVKKIYEEFLGEPGGHKAHELLHTTYVERKKYNI
jgi:NADP-reducing hydrogenase subunit HndD